MKTVVVIPIYQEMNDVEKVSLRQAVRIFREEPIVLMAPESMQVDSYLAYGSFSVERFEDRYFESGPTYSALLLEARFYQRFAAYDYLLIYQLDAFVFRDELPYFCSLGYDYIGAPWRILSVCRILAKNPVGNGGFSLRHVHHTAALLEHYADVIRRDWLPVLQTTGEDEFFAWAARQEGCPYTTAPIETACRFAMECDIQHRFRTMDKKSLPMGLHKWHQHDLAFWLPHIEKFEPVPLDHPTIRWMTTLELRIYMLMEQLLPRMAKQENRRRSQALACAVLPDNRSLYLRGRGIISDKVAGFLQKIGIPVNGTLDRGDSIPAEPHFILIASTRYEEEIVREFETEGRVMGRDFLTVRSFLHFLAWQSYGRHLKATAKESAAGKDRAGSSCVKLLSIDGGNRKKACAVLADVLPKSGRALAIGGWGECGKCLFELVEFCGWTVSVILDLDANPRDTYRSARFDLPEFDAIRYRNLFVLVASENDEEVICRNLAAHGFSEGRDFAKGTELARCIAEQQE